MAVASSGITTSAASGSVIITMNTREVMALIHTRDTREVIALVQVTALIHTTGRVFLCTRFRSKPIFIAIESISSFAHEPVTIVSTTIYALWLIFVIHVNFYHERDEIQIADV